MLELRMKAADFDHLEFGSEQLVDIGFARRIDECVDIDRHARPDIQRQRVRAADHVAHVVRF